ncbi:hypothetical protein ISS07_04220 [Candidatus Woesearchaeota archaeon]|nr:hypothetical protein [Candidatus Woesearchaeota archaeon]
MLTEIKTKIEDLESFIGFPVRRVLVTPAAKNPHDETLSYNLALRFYKKREEIEEAIIKVEAILVGLMNSGAESEDISVYFSLLGNMHYILGDFDKSVNCFMKSLSYNKEDLTSWVELIFSLRALGEFEIFEKIIFNLEKFYDLWIQENSYELNKDKIYWLISKIR